MRLRVVLDTNVVISGLLFGGPPRQILELAIEGVIDLGTSPALEDELERVLRLKFPQNRLEIRETLAAFQEITTRFFPQENIHAIAEDPADNRVLECALKMRADAIVSGDRHLLERKEFRAIPILSPHLFLTRWFPEKQEEI